MADVAAVVDIADGPPQERAVDLAKSPALVVGALAVGAHRSLQPRRGMIAMPMIALPLQQCVLRGRRRGWRRTPGVYINIIHHIKCFF